jgi:hypothetical protein
LPWRPNIKNKNLIVFPSTADGFRAAVSALHSLDGKECVSFHPFTRPEDHCMRLLVKKLGRVCLRVLSERSWNP